MLHMGTVCMHFINAFIFHNTIVKYKIRMSLKNGFGISQPLCLMVCCIDCIMQSIHHREQSSKPRPRLLPSLPAQPLRQPILPAARAVQGTVCDFHEKVIIAVGHIVLQCIISLTYSMAIVGIHDLYSNWPIKGVVPPVHWRQFIITATKSGLWKSLALTAMHHGVPEVCEGSLKKLLENHGGEQQCGTHAKGQSLYAIEEGEGEGDEFRLSRS